MATGTAKAKRRMLTAYLREERVSGFAPLAAGSPRVDRAKGIIYGVKIVGRTSPNTHGVKGAEGTDYTMEALNAAQPLYEGICVNVDHPPRGKPNEERSAYDRFAWLAETKVSDQGIFGNLCFLDPSDPLAVKMMNAAESKPDAFALSHNAIGKGEVRNGRYVITQIPEVRSVDIVADGGTNRSLFEGRDMAAKKITLKELLEAAPKSKYKRLRKLLEMYEDEGDQETTDGEEPDEMDHLYAAFKKCMEDDPEKANKILGMLKADEPDKKKDVEEDDEEDGDNDEKNKGDDEEPKGKSEEEKEAMKESRKRRVVRLAKGFLNLRENEQPPAKLVEALVKLPDEESRLSLLESWPRVAGRPGTSAPRSSSPNTPLRESADGFRAPKNHKEQAALLLRG